MRTITFQQYPRDAHNLLDEAQLKPHKRTISEQELKGIVKRSIEDANKKSSHVLLNIPAGTSEQDAAKEYKKSGAKLYDYFKKYFNDPAATAHQCRGRHYSDVAREQFRNRTLQRERMNAGWRYQYIAESAAQTSRRFKSVSGIGTIEADFNAVIEYEGKPGSLTIYVSVKNRTNTMGGQDWPKAIAAMENVAITDKNRTGEYICVFGIAMEKGKRIIKKNSKTNQPYSHNTEIWPSTFFWPFFTNCSYEAIIRTVLDALIETQKPETLDVPVPQELIDSFGECCRKDHLIDDTGHFNDPYRMVALFCGIKV